LVFQLLPLGFVVGKQQGVTQALQQNRRTIPLCEMGREGEGGGITISSRMSHL
jgi:hypothetical protein